MTSPFRPTRPPTVRHRVTSRCRDSNGGSAHAGPCSHWAAVLSPTPLAHGSELASNDMEQEDGPLVGDAAFDPRRFSGVVALQKPGVKEARATAGPACELGCKIDGGAASS